MCELRNRDTSHGRKDIELAGFGQRGRTRLCNRLYFVKMNDAPIGMGAESTGERVREITRLRARDRASAAWRAGRAWGRTRRAPPAPAASRELSRLLIALVGLSALSEDLPNRPGSAGKPASTFRGPYSPRAPWNAMRRSRCHSRRRSKLPQSETSLGHWRSRIDSADR